MQLLPIFDTTVFNNYVPFTGATADINLGTHNFITTGTLGAGAITGTSFIIGANTLSSFVNLDSLADLTFASTSFVKMTAAGTFGLDTIVYLPITGGTLTGNLLFTDASYDIGATGATRPRDLFLSRNATIGSLTATRIPYASTGGLLVDSANLTFDGTNVIGLGYGRFDAGLGIGIAPAAAQIKQTYSPTGLSGVGYYLLANSLWNGATPTNPVHRGINFNAGWTPAVGASGNRTITLLQGGYGLLNFDTLNLTDARNYTIGTAAIFDSGMTISRTTTAGYSGVMTLTTLYNFRAQNAAVTGTPTITTCYAFYDAGQTAATNNWGLGINTANNYINGSLRIGSAVAPTVPFDLTGAALMSSTLGVTGLITATGGIDVAAGQVYKLNNVQVVGARIVDARCDDAINSGDATTDGVIDALRDCLITHGLLAAA